MRAQFFCICFMIFVLIERSTQIEILTSENDICRLFVNGIKLRKPGTCNEGIVCNNFKSEFFKICSGEQPIYSKDYVNCVAKTTDDYCKSSCSKNSPLFVSDPKNCNAWYKCNGDETLEFSHCPEDLHFDQPKQSCVYADQTNCEAKYEFCDVIPNNIRFRDEDNCHKYYVCVKDKLTVETCDLGTYYNVRMGKCIAKAQVVCYKHPYPENVCGTTKLAKRNQFVSDQATCRGYFYCRDFGSGKPDQNPIWSQCSVGKFFNEKRQFCASRAHVKCTEDRCEGRIDGYEISEKKGCQHYLVCKNNYTVREGYCGETNYFNVDNNFCTYEKVKYDACA